VTNLSNNKLVVVRINDRGPYVRRRIIDLTKAAAKEIGLLEAGVAKVNIMHKKINP
jgi:rare lipoprotein A